MTEKLPINLLRDEAYRSLLSEIKSRLKAAQLRAIQAVENGGHIANYNNKLEVGYFIDIYRTKCYSKGGGK